MSDTQVTQVTAVSKIMDLLDSVKPTIMGGNVDEVNALKEKAVYLKELANELVSAFDNTLDNAKSGYLGDDFLAEVSRIYKPRGRTAGDKPEKIRPVF